MIEDKIPDHSAFSRARNERFRDSGIFRSVFERVVGACIGAGLVGGEGFAVDASLIVADANKQRSTPGAQWNKELNAQAVSRATKEYLQGRAAEARARAAPEDRPAYRQRRDSARNRQSTNRPSYGRKVCAFFAPRHQSSVARRRRDDMDRIRGRPRGEPLGPPFSRPNTCQAAFPARAADLGLGTGLLAKIN